MKSIYFLLAIGFLISCNNSEEEEEFFDYYEPIIGETFQTISDPESKVDYQYSTEDDLTVETTDASGLNYSIHIPAEALAPNFSKEFGGSIAPLVGIQNLPDGANFQFGIEIEPYGYRFVKPVEITIDLPANFDTKNLLGFYNEEAMGARLEPMKIRRRSTGIQVVFQVLHFSSYGGLTYVGNALSCPEARSAQSCDDLREIIGCTLGAYEVGINEQLSQEDQNKASNILKLWMEEQLKYADLEGGMDYTDIYEFEFELSEYLCWKSMTQEFNGNANSYFADLYQKAEGVIRKGFNSVVAELEDLCMSSLTPPEECPSGNSVLTTKSYLQWYAIAQQLGIENDLEVSDILQFCEGSLTRLLVDFALVDPSTLQEFQHNSSGGIKVYLVELPAANSQINVRHIMANLLDEAIDLEETDIQWISTTLEEDQAFYYLNGTVAMKSEAVEYINQCTIDCLDAFAGGFDIYRNNCWVAQAMVIWSRD